MKVTAARRLVAIATTHERPDTPRATNVQRDLESSTRAFRRMTSSRVPRSALAVRRDELRRFYDGVYAVHATNYFPAGGVIRTKASAAPSFRSTVHFALGELVQSHSFGNWEKSRYGIILPLEALDRQIANVFHQDTFVIGDVQLPNGTIVVAAKDAAVEELPGVRIVRFDPARSTLRKTIDSVIRQRGGKLFRGAGGHLKDSVTHGCRDVNGAGFFAPLLRQRPHLTFGLHSATVIGKLDMRCSMVFPRLGSGGFGASFTATTWRLELEQMRRWAAEADAFVTKLDLPDASKAAWARDQRRLADNLSLIEVEIELQVRHGRTLLGSKLSDEQVATIQAHAASPTTLVQALNVHELAESPDPPDGHNPTHDLFFYTSDHTPQELSRFLRDNPDLADAVGGHDALLAIRALMDAAKNPESTDDALRLATRELQRADRGAAWQLVTRLLRNPVTRERRAEWLGDAAAAENLGKYFDVEKLYGNDPDDPVQVAYVAFRRTPKKR